MVRNFKFHFCAPHDHPPFVHFLSAETFNHALDEVRDIIEKKDRRILLWEPDHSLLDHNGLKINQDALCSPYSIGREFKHLNKPSQKKLNLDKKAKHHQKKKKEVRNPLHKNDLYGIHIDGIPEAVRLAATFKGPAGTNLFYVHDLDLLEKMKTSSFDYSEIAGRVSEPIVVAPKQVGFIFGVDSGDIARPHVAPKASMAGDRHFADIVLGRI